MRIPPPLVIGHARAQPPQQAHLGGTAHGLAPIEPQSPSDSRRTTGSAPFFPDAGLDLLVWSTHERFDGDAEGRVVLPAKHGAASRSSREPPASSAWNIHSRDPQRLQATLQRVRS
jgi:hypothetical protein